MSHAPPAPHTDRTPDDVLSDPRPGDTFTHTARGVNTPATIVEDDDGLGVRVAWTHYGEGYLRTILPGVLHPRPRCLATDPRPGDTVVGPHGHREVTHVEGTGGDRVVWYLDATGDTYTTPLDAWAVSARAWTACYDRRGGARFDPQPGDRACACADVGWEVTARVGDLLALVHVTTDATATCPVEVWADAGGAAVLFPARYVRAVRS